MSLRATVAAAVSGAVFCAVACNKADNSVDLGPAPGATGSAVAPSAGSAKPAGGGFSADLSAEIGSAGKPAAESDARPSESAPAPAAGSDAKPAAAPPTPSAAPAAATPPSPAIPNPATPPSATPPPPAAKPTPTTPALATPVKPSGDLAAIKLSLLPNWDRDIGTAGTFQYVVRIKGTQSTKTFTFNYGYDDPRAPVDRDQYKKFLQDAKLLTGEIKDRQRGSAWFLEGADASGAPAFRYVVLYGGKRLVCFGPLYKDADSNRLGDDRDQTVIQAKQICESLSL
jgi:hypothetical protein